MVWIYLKNTWIYNYKKDYYKDCYKLSILYVYYWYYKNLITVTQLAAIHAKRVTIMAKDYTVRSKYAEAYA